MATREVQPAKTLLTAIGAERLIAYFEFLDELRESGNANMFGAGANLRAEYPGMSKQESYVVLSAWMGQNLDLPVEDRALNAIEAEAA